MILGEEWAVKPPAPFTSFAALQAAAMTEGSSMAMGTTSFAALQAAAMTEGSSMAMGTT
eukprot:CAMPEP_0201285698 /NCGR_PEP_ID=MMETSP1317-20130820/113706_1 /ASSEMBLY_ACC=CAM_ASM_000770 /TAXON_ID=187299 /ORGANISM="Undescribed Undescribed, Strain Undescribed" /LENGTH=58 /DNA_ID=CAMNT_0047611501 /DNA_START=1131 /DNA_END=1307 /DNA_ORIENTATION=-